MRRRHTACSGLCALLLALLCLAQAAAQDAPYRRPDKAYFDSVRAAKQARHDSMANAILGDWPDESLAPRAYLDSLRQARQAAHRQAQEAERKANRAAAPWLVLDFQLAGLMEYTPAAGIEININDRWAGRLAMSYNWYQAVQTGDPYFEEPISGYYASAMEAQARYYLPPGRPMNGLFVAPYAAWVQIHYRQEWGPDDARRRGRYYGESFPVGVLLGRHHVIMKRRLTLQYALGGGPVLGARTRAPADGPAFSSGRHTPVGNLFHAMQRTFYPRIELGAGLALYRTDGR